MNGGNFRKPIVKFWRSQLNGSSVVWMLQHFHSLSVTSPAFVITGIDEVSIDLQTTLDHYIFQNNL